MPKFREKPVVVDAFRWTGDNLEQVKTWAVAADRKARKRLGKDQRETPLQVSVVDDYHGVRLEIPYDERSTAVADVGNWLVCDWKGRFWPIDHDEFIGTYEEVI